MACFALQNFAGPVHGVVRGKNYIAQQSGLEGSVHAVTTWFRNNILIENRKGVNSPYKFHHIDRKREKV